jgi:hypothetical protein
LPAPACWSKIGIDRKSVSGFPRGGITATTLVAIIMSRFAEVSVKVKIGRARDDLARPMPLQRKSQVMCEAPHTSSGVGELLVRCTWCGARPLGC